PARRRASARAPVEVIELEANEILVSLASSYNGEAVAIHQHLCHARARVVVERHHVPIRASGAHDEEVARLDVFHLAVECEKVAALAYGPHDIHHRSLLAPLHRL